MKNLRLMVLATITMLFMGMANLNAQETNPQTVIISATLRYSTGKSFMHIIKPNGEGQILDIEKSKGDKRLNNYAAFQSQINKWRKQGFKIDGMTSYVSSNSFNDSVVMVILTKE